MKAKGMPEVDWWFYAQRQSDFVLKDNLLFLKTTLANSTETMSVFVVLEQKCQAAFDGYHQYAGHQGHGQTLSLIKEWFWWPGMAQALVLVVPNCGHCKKYATHNLHRTDGAGTCRLHRNGSHHGYLGEISCKECISGSQSLYSVCPSICYPEPDSKNNCLGTL